MKENIYQKDSRSHLQALLLHSGLVRYHDQELELARRRRRDGWFSGVCHCSAEVVLDLRVLKSGLR
jgi:hypothetical protein